MNNLFKTTLLSALIGCSSIAHAAWIQADSSVELASSRASFDRVNRVYNSVVTVSNNAGEALIGPLRILITDNSIPVVEADGYTDSGIPFVMIDADTLSPGESLSVNVQFELQRKGLTYTPMLEQNNPNVGVYAQAEGGQSATLNFLGADMRIEEGPPQFVTASVNGVDEPANDNRVGELAVSFESAGDYTLYARVRIGPQGDNDDSFYIAQGLGNNQGWVLVNSILGHAAPGEDGYIPGAIVDTGGNDAPGAFRWVKIPDGQYSVADDSTTAIFRYAGREDGLDIDKFAFAPEGVTYTVEQLENGEPGERLPPPEPFEPEGPPLAQGQDKFLGGVCCGSQRPNFEAYWNQVTPENAGKWGSVEAVRDEYNWAGLDEAYQVAKDNGFIYKHHVLVWGSQQPGWISDLEPAEQLSEIREWFELVNARYPDIDFIEVVNEFDNAPPDGLDGRPDYVDGLRLFNPETTAQVEAYFINQGDSPEDAAQKASDYDWIVNAFQMARDIFPSSTQLMFNEYSVVNSNERTQKVIDLANLLQSRNLIDAVGFQGHAFSTTGPLETQRNNVDRIDQQTGLDIYMTELDIDGPDELTQLLEYQRLFPMYWNHPAIEGITVWGYLPGHWREAQGAILAYDNGAEKPALKWLKGYVREVAPQFNQPGTITIDETTEIGTQIADFTSFDASGNAHSAQSDVVWAVLGGNEDGRFALDENTGQLTVADDLVPGIYNLYVQVQEGEYTSFARQVQIVVPGDNLPPTVIEYNFTEGVQGWRGDYGTSASVSYDNSTPAALLEPDWQASNEQVYIEEVSLSDLTGASLTYTFNVTQEQAEGGLTIQPFVQTGAPSYARIYGDAVAVQAGENVISFEPEDNAAGDLTIVERLGVQLNGPLSNGNTQSVAMTHVRLEIPTVIPAAETVVYDFADGDEGMQGEFGTDATVTYQASQQAVSLQPNGTSETHNYILQAGSRDYTDATITYTLRLTGQPGESDLTVQGYVQTGAPDYVRIYGTIEPLSLGSNLVIFNPQSNDAGAIANIERIALQINGAFVSDDDNQILVERIEADFP